ncbi:MAG: hypothetical protein IPL40_05655 [Proteobacteria bacterium]|nr:hypothetical protein [Pseudomonadota bacterium]
MGKATRILEVDQLLATLQRHPRLVHQGLLASAEQEARLHATLRPLVAFARASYVGCIAVLDWDHRLPSQQAVLRLYAYYSPNAFDQGASALAARSAAIAERDLQPEFDVPDYTGLGADEVYEGEVDAEGTVVPMRLVSGWRREINPKDARSALRAARQSEQFQRLLAATKGKRPNHLGELEAVAWTPPCETDSTRWTIDVWYLMQLDHTLGRGHSFLVDPEQQRVLAEREFVVRGG